jgi:[ribosomal protein S5]-alanine N-acetyltransferase
MTTEPTVTLRDCTASDLDALEEYWIPEVRRWLAGTAEPGDRRSTQEYVDRAMESARTVPRLRYELVAEANGRFLGTGRIVASDPLNASGDMGYAIRQGEWGKGYATAVARQLLAIGFGPLGLHRVSATVHPENAAGIRVLEKAGLRYEGRLRDHYRVPGGWRDSLLYAVLATDADAVAG